MSITIRDAGIRKALNQALSQGSINEINVRGIIDGAKDGGRVTATERRDLNTILNHYSDRFDDVADWNNTAKVQLNRFLDSDGWKKALPNGFMDRKVDTHFGGQIHGRSTGFDATFRLTGSKTDKNAPLKLTYTIGRFDDGSYWGKPEELYLGADGRFSSTAGPFGYLNNKGEVVVEGFSWGSLDNWSGPRNLKLKDA